MVNGHMAESIMSAVLISRHKVHTLSIMIGNVKFY